MPVAALPSVRLNYIQLPSRQRGLAEGEDVVMIHGLAANMAFWYVGAAPAFTRVGRVTLYDLRGHGYSEMPSAGYSPRVMAQDLRQLLDLLEIRCAHLVAHSFGGAVALSFALSFPERVRTLVLADVRIRAVEPQLLLKSWPRWPQISRRLGKLGITLDKSHPEAGLQVVTEVARLQIERPEMGDELSRLLLRTRSRLFGTKQARRWLRLLDATTAPVDVLEDPLESARDLEKIHHPVFAVFGENSMSLASGRALGAGCPNCTFEILPKAGHFFPITRPRAFARMSLGFLARHTRFDPTDVISPRRAARRHRRWQRRGGDGAGRLVGESGAEGDEDVRRAGATPATGRDRRGSQGQDDDAADGG